LVGVVRRVGERRMRETSAAARPASGVLLLLLSKLLL
jgi:hypothetical protein